MSAPNGQLGQAGSEVATPFCYSHVGNYPYQDEDCKHVSAASAVKEALIRIFVTHGLPEVLYSDNMPYDSGELRKFYSTHSIRHITSSPGYAQSNGIAEIYVKIAKKLIRKANSESELYWLLKQYRSTPIPALNASPAEILFSRRIRTDLPIYPKAMRLGLNGLETGDAGIRTRTRFQPVYALVQARTR